MTYSLVFSFIHGISFTAMLDGLRLGLYAGIFLYVSLFAVYKIEYFIGLEKESVKGRPLHPFVKFLIWFISITVPTIVLLSVAGVIPYS